MNLTLKQAYLVMFCMMDTYYERTKLDDISALLGSFNPYLFEGKISAEPAVWSDWVNCVKKITSHDYLRKMKR